MQKNNKDYYIIAGKLLIICSIVAFIVATVNFITKDKIAYNEMKNTAIALTDIFSENFGGNSFSVKDDGFEVREDNKVIAVCKKADCVMNEDVTSVYVIEDIENAPLYYCVALSPMGFKAEINMLVAVNSDLTVKGVKIVSMSETSGIGTKADDKTFLSKFKGKTETQALEVDTISGATKTTEPIIEAVANACNQVGSYKASLSGGAN